MIKKLKNIINNEYIFSVVAKVVGVVTGLIYTILYRRYFGTELTGEGAVILNQGTMISLILCLGIYQAYPYFRKMGQKTPEVLYQEYIDRVMGLFLVYAGICALLYFFAPLNQDLRTAFVLVPLMVAIKELNYVVLIERPKLRNTASILLNLADIVLVLILFIAVKPSFTMICLFLILKEGIYFIIAFQNLKVPVWKLRPTLKGIGPYIRFGIIPMITVILMEVNYKVDVLMLDGKVAKAEIGVYSLGVQLAERLWLIPDALKDILLSKLAKGKGAEEAARVTRISLALMVVCVLVAVALGRPFINLLFGTAYSGAYEIMLVILASVISMVFYKMIYSYNVANGKRVVNMVILGVAAALNVLLNWILIPPMGIYGAAVASLASYTICGAAFLIYFQRETGIPYKDILFVRKQDWTMLRKIVDRKRKKA